MSKGLGSVETYILKTIEFRSVGINYRQLVGLMPQTNPASIRRALGSLRRKGLIDVHPGYYPNVYTMSRMAKRSRQRQAKVRREQERDRIRREQEARASAERREREQFDFDDDLGFAPLAGRRRNDPTLRKLAAALGRLASDQLGEVANAVQTVNKLQKKTGQTWQQLLGLGD